MELPLGAGAGSSADTWITVALASLNVVQVVLLAWIADRGRRIRRRDLH